MQVSGDDQTRTTPFKKEHGAQQTDVHAWLGVGVLFKNPDLQATSLNRVWFTSSEGGQGPGFGGLLFSLQQFQILCQFSTMVSTIVWVFPANIFL